MNGNARARRHRRASSSSPTHRGRARAHARAEHRARTRGDHPRRTIRRVNLSRIHPSSGRAVDRAVDRSSDRALAPSRPRAIVSPITTRREGGATATTTEGGGRDHRSRLVAVSPRLIFIPTGTGRIRVPNASIVAPTSSPSLGTFDRVRIEPLAIRLATPRTLFRRDGRTRWRARGRRETTTGDERRETGDGRRETRDAASSATRARRRRPSRRLDEGGRGTRRDDGVGALFPRVGGREGGTRSPVITPRG